MKEHKHIVLTGGHSGMGLELTKMLLKQGHTIGLLLRNEKRKLETMALLGNSTNIHYFFADLGDRDALAKVSREITNAWPKIDVLFNNAGVLTDKLYRSKRGNELQLEVNAISPYLLTEALYPLLSKSNSPTVVNTATTGLQKKIAFDIEGFKNPKKFSKLTGSYMDSKLMMVLLMDYLDRLWPDVNIISADPGAIKTKMTASKGMPFWLKPIRKLFFRSPKEGARKLYEAAFSKRDSNSGSYRSKGKAMVMTLRLKETDIERLLE
ncbi:SDR family NAD(P)-dependent oxidoreductase [Flagellimonas sp. DF-77]|uniref:SDR family NAD(P)-dependent oxidoreductase n=1 Tax=Flagellimonas algarum TaxID=3230298 RepID=UPI003397FD3A